MNVDREYPEHEKLRAIQDKSQAIGDFVEWLSRVKHYYLAEYHEHTDDCYSTGSKYSSSKHRTCGSSEEVLYSVNLSITKLLAEYYDIDLDKLEEEKRQMLEDMRRINEELDRREKEKKT